MTASVSTIRKGLQGALESIDGLRAHDIWPGSIAPPAGLVRVKSIDYAETFDNATRFHFEIVLVVRMANVRGSQASLDAYLNADGPSSVATVVEADQTLGGISEIVNCISAHSYGELLIGQTMYLGAVFDVEVLAR